VIPIGAIKRAVAVEAGITVQEIEGQNRSPHLARPRMVAMYLSRELGGPRNSFPYIGTQFGRDHSTILSGVRRVAELIEAEPAFAQFVFRCKKRVSHEALTSEEQEVRMRDVWRRSLGLRTPEDRYALECGVL